MPYPKASRERCEQAVQLVEEQLRQGCVPLGQSGGRSAVQAAAEVAQQSGLVGARTSFTGILAAAKDHYGLSPDWSQFRAARYQQPVARYELVNADPPRPGLLSGVRRRVLVIPDRHNDPRHEHRLACSTWIARFGSEMRCDDVVCLGDAGTYDSVSRHDKNDTLRGRAKPPIRADLDNHEQQERAFEFGRDPSWKPRKHKVRGNHEQRIFDFENDHPEDEGTHTHRYAQTLLQFGWRERSYGEILFLDEVGFTHAPFHMGGGPMGGITIGQRASNLLVNTVFHGHTHRRALYDAPKHGDRGTVSVISPGCALPWGEVEQYARVSPGGWWWGVAIADLIDGLVPRIEFIDMLSLRERYSDDGADIAA